MKTIMMLPFLLAVFMCEAQRFQLSGTVLSGHQAVPGATVSLQNTNHSTVTDENGVFTFDDLLPAEYKIQISSIGYFTVVQKAVITNDNLHIQVQLSIDSKNLDSVTIQTAGQNAFGFYATARCGRNIHLCRQENRSGRAE